MSKRLSQCTSPQWQDGLSLICGEIIGEGISRTVYECKLNPAWVVKHEFNMALHQNVLEYTVWERVRELDVSSWFAPVLHLSDHGCWMIQARTKPVTLQELKRAYPRVPGFLTDFKVSNWGRLGTRLVCHDFGSCYTTECGINKKTIKAEWWELETSKT